MKNLFVDRVCKPKSFGRARPQLPERNYVIDSGLYTHADDATAAVSGQEGVDTAFEAVAQLVEEELCQTYDCITKKQ